MNDAIEVEGSLCVHVWRPATVRGYSLSVPVVKCIHCGKAVRC